VKPILKNARAGQDHQDLIVGYARTFIHGVQAVQKAYHLLLIEERDRSQDRAAECILHQRAEFLLGVQGGRRAQEWVLLSAIDLTIRKPTGTLGRSKWDGGWRNRKLEATNQKL
jgi:hypothetical protein